jgi:hypothetical protein
MHQVLAMIRFLPSFWDTYAHLLAVTDLSSFSQFAAVDCILPSSWAVGQAAGQEHTSAGSFAYARLLLAAFGVPVLLLLAYLLLWVIKWLLHKARQGHQATVLPDSPSCSTSSSAARPGSFPWLGLGLKSYISSSSASASKPAGQGSFAKPPAVSVGSASGMQPSSPSRAHQLDAPSPEASPRSAASSPRSFAGSSALGMQLGHPAGSQQPLPPLHTYLSRRMAVTAVVLGYVCYSLFTSSMLQALACHPIQDVTGSSAIVQEYQQMHDAWLHQRGKELQQIPLKAAGLSNLNPVSVDEHATTVKAGQRYWKQDYAVPVSLPPQGCLSCGSVCTHACWMQFWSRVSCWSNQPHVCCR